MLLRYCLPIFLFALGFSLQAQDCRFQLFMEDVRGDGWNGGELTIRVAGVSTTYTLTEAMNSDGPVSVFFDVNDGDAVQLDFQRGAFPEETSFSILNNADSLIYASGLSPMEGMNIFSFTAACVTCAPPPAASISFFRVRSMSVDVNFGSSPAAANPLYLVEYGQGNFDPATDEDGLSLARTDTTFRISNLQPDTLYTFWISTICQAEMDTTIRRGPFQIMTQKRADVGITQLMSPVSACDLGAEAITIGITNFGGEAQAFFNVDFLINDQPSGLSRPDDGIFTGVVGVDSTEFFTFDIQAFMSQPGTYKFSLFTDLEEDEDRTNDTLVIYVTHVPLITDFPYTENFEASNGAWYTERGGRGASSWRWGKPDGSFIDRAPQGENAWVTNLRGDYNNNEKSFLYSPCFDLSDMTEDPLFSAVLRVETEENFDDVYLEITTDKGDNWSRVETSPAGVNWYNDLANQSWEGDGGLNGRATLVAQLLENVAGEEIQLRFVFNSSRSGTMEGVLVDAVSLGERAENNLAAVSASADAQCVVFSSAGFNFTFANVGTTTAQNIMLSLLVDGNIITETYPDSLRPNQQATYFFDMGSINSTFSDPIPFWVTLQGDVQASNDTTILNFSGYGELPFYEDFENGRIPDLWTLDNDLSISLLPGNGSLTISDTLSAVDTVMNFFTATYQGLVATDTLRFDVSLGDTDNNMAYTGLAKLTIRAADFCDVGVVIYTVDTLTAGTYALGLPEEALGATRFDFLVEWAEGDFAIGFDNINIARCPANLGLIVNILGVSEPGAADALATVTVTDGLAPYTYLWSTGDMTSTADNLAEGFLTVVVTDAVGCADSTSIVVDMSTAVDDPADLLTNLSVFPNPTTGSLQLQLDLPAAEDVQVDLYDLNGRKLLSRNFGYQLRLNEQLNLQEFPAGVYLLRLQTSGAARTIRVIKR